jgi:hypothetical protein
MLMGVFMMFKADTIVETCYAKTDRDGYPIGGSDVGGSDEASDER